MSKHSDRVPIDVEQFDSSRSPRDIADTTQALCSQLFQECPIFVQKSHVSGQCRDVADRVHERILKMLTDSTSGVGYEQNTAATSSFSRDERATLFDARQN
jgi:hypothetical protein